MPPSPIGDSVNPTVPSSDRKIVTDTNLSLLVTSVRETQSSLTTSAESLGGFMVNSSLSAPLEATSGNLTVRIPTPKLNEYLSLVRSAAVRVVSENIMGRDVTDQYLDIEARLETLTKTKAIYENLLDQAKDLNEILRVQQTIISHQDQIDRLVGQKNYLANTAATASVTLYLSTDELALPYSPAEPYRPAVVFKTAARHLNLTLRKLLSLGIWAGVYSVV